MLHLKNSIAWSWFSGNFLQNYDLSRGFFHFFKILIFGLLERLKGKTWSKMTKNYVNHTLHQETCIRWLSIYGTHVSNHNISMSFFHFFNILFFWIIRGVKGQNVPKWQKICLSHAVSPKPYIMIVIIGTHV